MHACTHTHIYIYYKERASIALGLYLRGFFRGGGIFPGGGGGGFFRGEGGGGGGGATFVGSFFRIYFRGGGFFPDTILNISANKINKILLVINVY